MTSPEHRALVVQIPTAAKGQANGAALRVQDVTQALTAAGVTPVLVSPAEVAGAPGRYCLGVAVSYASAGAVAGLRTKASRVWLDAMDSWLLINRSGVRHGNPTYAARAARDAVRLLRMPRPDLVTYISRADLTADHGTVRASRRLVLPGLGGQVPVLQAQGERRRAVLVGDWAYPPNRDGLAWFRQQVLPRLHDVDVVVYGPGAARTGRDRVEGYVQDGALLYRQGDVHVAPVRFGGGVKRKVLQPLLAGLPVVTTPAGAHGLQPHPLLDVRADAGAFAAALQARLSNHAPTTRPAAGDLLDGDDTAEVARWLAQVAATCCQGPSTSSA